MVHKRECFENKVQVRAFPVRKAQGLQVRAAIHTGVPPQTLALREAIAQKPTLLSLRDRLMAGEVPRSKRGKVTGRGGPLMRTSSGKVAGKAFPVR